jgi:hypothetical protein
VILRITGPAKVIANAALKIIHSILAMKTERPAIDRRLKLAWGVALAGVVARLILLIWAGNRDETPLTGGSDTLAYQALADSIVHLRGMTYASVPTALRAPLYPYFLALVQLAFGAHYRFAARLIQFVAGVVVALVCARASAKIGGHEPIALATALAMPTLMFFSAELLTETFATLLVAVFFLAVLESRSAIAMGAVIGVAMLARFNLAALAVVYIAWQLFLNKLPVAVRNLSVAGAIAAAIVSPWFVRNLVVFHGQALYSTQTGMNFLEGMVTPDGRTHGDDWDKLASRCGCPVRDLEVNSASRQALPSEPELDRRAAHAAVAEVPRIHFLSLGARKLSYFWLSFDQVFETQDMERGPHLVRIACILTYWFFLVVGLRGWVKCKSRNTGVAPLFVLYAVVVTCLHLPFVMSTRIRTPFVEPALAVLAGLGFSRRLPGAKAADTRLGMRATVENSEEQAQPRSPLFSRIPILVEDQRIHMQSP